MTNDVLKQMLENAVHFGRKTSKWNAKMAPYIYGQRKGMHVFDLAKTEECLKEAMAFVEKTASEGKKILVVSTKPQTLDLIPQKCEELGLPYVTQRWFAGLLTNFTTIKSRIRYLKKMKEMMANGEIQRYTKAEQTQIRKEIGKLQNALGGVENMDKIPSAIFITDTVRDHTAAVEARKLKVTSVGLCDSDANPDEVDYVVPSNVRSVKALKFMLDKFFEAYAKGRKSAPVKVEGAIKADKKPAPKAIKKD